MDPEIKICLIVLAVAVSISVAIQASVLFELFWELRSLRRRIRELNFSPVSWQPAAEEIVVGARETVALRRIAQDVAEIADRMKDAVNEGRDFLHKEITRADHFADDLLARVERIREQLERRVVQPVRELKAVSAGVRAGLADLLGKKEADGRSNASHAIRSYFLFLLLANPFSLIFPRLHASQQDEQVVYEGQMVSAINLVARPTITVERLQNLIQQKAGEPYSSEKIHNSTAALRQTGLFAKIDIEVTPLATGLEVEFVLQPAFYIGMTRFPGADNGFEYSRLLQAVNYPSQEPYDEDRVRESEAALLQFLVSNGYFLSTVRAEVEFDEADQLADLIFHVTLNRRAEFGSVQVAGIPAEYAARVENALHSIRARLRGAYLKPGKVYDAARLRSATTFIRDTLNRMKRLAEDVSLKPPRYDPETNRADISFFVTLGPSVEVRAEGARVSQGALRRLIPIFEENAFDQDLVEEGKRNLASHFQSKGFFDVTVNPVVLTEPEKLQLIYQIDRGDRHRVLEVAIRGNRYFDDETLLPLVAIRPAGWWWLSRGRFSEDLLNDSVESLTRYYQDAGFPDVTVEPHVDDKEARIYVTFDIVEGGQTLVNEFHLEGNQTQSISALAPGGLNLGPGRPYSQRLLNQDRDRIMARYLNFGYLSGSFESTVQPLPGEHQVDVTFRVEEGPQTYISNVAPVGADQTQPWYLDRIADIHPGQSFSQGNLLSAESRLYETGLFDWASVAPKKPITDQTEEKVLVKVHEAKRNTLSYGFGLELSPRTANIPAGSVALPGSLIVALPSTFKRTQKQFVSPRGSIEYSRRNLRGEGETATFSTLFSRLDQRLSFTYANPYLLRSRWNWHSLVSLFGERTTENPIYTERLGEAAFQVERPLDRARTRTLLLRYSFSRTALYDVLIPEIVLPQDRSVRLSTLAASYVRDTRDRPLDARRGIYQSFDFAVNPKAIGSTANFLRLVGQTSHYRQVRPWLVWAGNVRLGIAKPFAGSQVPLSKRFFSGGGNTLRGFPFNGAGPQRPVPVCSDPNDPPTCTNITVPVGGNAVFIINSEARIPIPVMKGLGGVFFYDGGNVYRRIGLKHLLSDYSNTIGFGLRYDTPVGPIRFDIGRNLQPPDGIRATQFFVTLGQSF